jgi:hypothetical protein
VSAIEERLAEVTHLPLENGEPLHVRLQQGAGGCHTAERHVLPCVCSLSQCAQCCGVLFQAGAGCLPSMAAVDFGAGSNSSGMHMHVPAPCTLYITPLL